MDLMYFKNMDILCDLINLKIIGNRIEEIFSSN